MRSEGAVHVILTVTVLLSLLEFLDEVIARLLTAWGAVRTQNILISHCTACVIPTYRQAKPLPLPESNLYHTFFSSQNTTNLHFKTQYIPNFSGMEAQQISNPSGMEAQQISNPSGMEAQQIFNPSGMEAQQIFNPSGMEAQQTSNPSETVKTQQISNSSVPTSVQPHPLPFIQTYPLFSTISKSVLILLFDNLAICITIHYYPTDPPLLPTPAWAFQVPTTTPSHTEHSS